ncbi:MAG: RNA methyltransferase [Parasporobacterium sp.]|nr:RNA methyltransferase [Parasporobacterium sp.]
MAKIQFITDPSFPGLELYSASETALLRYHEPKPGIFIAESEKVLLRALDAGYEPVSLLMEDRYEPSETHPLVLGCQEAYSRSAAGDFPVYVGSYELLKNTAGYGLTGGILCAMHRKPLPSVLSILSSSNRIAILENIVNPTNIGAIFRSAAAMNVDAILLTAACCDPLYRRAVRVSMGNVFLMPWTYLRPVRKRLDTSNRWESTEGLEDYLPADHSSESYDHQGWPSPWLQILKNMGYTTAAMALEERAVSVSDPALKNAGKLAIILGTEGEGLLARTIEGCDYTVKIPMGEGVDSLNVAAASAVAFWELCMKK